MSQQLQLDLPPGGETRVDGRTLLARTGQLGARLLRWAPVWVPVLVAAQVTLRGLLPALAESRRLDGAEAAVQAREDALWADHERLEREERMLADPIWRERVRRSLTDPSRPPVSLAGADPGS